MSEDAKDVEPILVELTEHDVEKRISDFSDLLKDIENLSDKKRALWKEIYENALSDRQNSYVVFSQVFKLINSKSTEYAVHGKTLTMCVERMSRANDQLIKLAELIAKAEDKNNEIDPEDMFSRINKK